MNLQPYFTEIREVIRKRGWIQDEYHDLDGHVCLVGAVRLVCVRAHSRVDVFNALIAEIVRDLPPAGVPWSCDGIDRITRWNDHVDRTYAEVDAFLARLAGAPVVETVVEEEEEAMVCA